MVAIAKSEFEERIARIQEALARKGLDAMLVYGDEYRPPSKIVLTRSELLPTGTCALPAPVVRLLGGFHGGAAPAWRPRPGGLPGANPGRPPGGGVVLPRSGRRWRRRRGGERKSLSLPDAKSRNLGIRTAAM
jgi:hypothetical protein